VIDNGLVEHVVEGNRRNAAFARDSRATTTMPKTST
jgi:hypothetical protein